LRRFEQHAFVILLTMTLSCGIIGFYMLMAGGATASKWIASTGLFATVTGVVQFEVSGLFQKIMEIYGDEEKYPYGPPSYITREIVANPDRPFVTCLQHVCFFNVKTGFWLIVIGTLIQVVAVWV